MKTIVRAVRIIVPIIVLVSAAARAADAGVPCESKLDPAVRAAMAYLEGDQPVSETPDATLAIAPGSMLDVFIVGDVDPADLAAAGVVVRTSLAGFCTAFVPLASVENVVRLEAVDRLLGARPVEAALDVSVPTCGVVNLRGPGPEFSGANGEGVILGAVDTGVDFDHPDFLHQDGTTRLLAIWDQNDSSGPPPSGQTYGTEWSAADIDADIASQVDTSGHGTHVLGIAGGDGSATGGGVPPHTYNGVAPRADLVMVKGDLLNTTRVVDGVAYVFGLADAAGKNAVVNLSLQYMLGPHDATGQFEAALDALSGPGRIICVAAGNFRGRPWHAEAHAATPQNVVTIDISGSDPGSYVDADGYYDGSEIVTVALTTPSGQTVGPVALGEENAMWPGEDTPEGHIYLMNQLYWSPVNPEIFLRVQADVSGEIDGTWTLTFTPVQVGGFNGEVDMWMVPTSGTSAAFVVGGQPDEEMVAIPGNARDVVTVAAWSSKTEWVGCNGGVWSHAGSTPLGTLYALSGMGPTRDNRLKPDICAPGISIASATSFDGPATCPAMGEWTSLQADGMQHRAGQGTSMATPHVAGAVALLLQTEGALTPDQVKQHLAIYAVADEFTGAVPNYDWGHGKLYLDGLTSVGREGFATSIEGVGAVWPNPASSAISIRMRAHPGRASRVNIYDVRGRLVAETKTEVAGSDGVASATWDGLLRDGRRAPGGTYFARVEGRADAAQRIVILK